MSTNAEDVTATISRPGENSAEPVDQIANLLAGEDESETTDTEEEVTPVQVSTEAEDKESNEEEAEGEDEEVEETELEAIADDEATWETTLGVEDGQLSFNEDGDINGVNVKVDGETSTIGIKDLIAGYQTNKSVTQRSQALAEEKKIFDGQKEQMEQVYASKLTSVDALTKHFEKQLISEYDTVDWEKLRVEDPAEYAAAKQDFSAKAGELQKIQDAIKIDQDQHSVEFNESRAESANAYKQKQFEIMIENNPEWADKEKLNASKQLFESFVLDQYGFEAQEFDSVFDARLIELIKDAKMYRDGLKVAGKKKQKPVPKFQKSRGTSKTKVSKLDKLTAASKKAHGEDRRNLQQSAVAELLLGG
jgi:hypothetical protein